MYIYSYMVIEKINQRITANTNLSLMSTPRTYNPQAPPRPAAAKANTPSSPQLGTGVADRLPSPALSEPPDRMAASPVHEPQLATEAEEHVCVAPLVVICVSVGVGLVSLQPTLSLPLIFPRTSDKLTVARLVTLELY